MTWKRGLELLLAFALAMAPLPLVLLSEYLHP
jgi:hypothetical protein